MVALEKLVPRPATRYPIGARCLLLQPWVGHFLMRHHASCTMHNAACSMHHVSCIMCHVSCIMYHASCIMQNLSGISHPAFCIVHAASGMTSGCNLGPCIHVAQMDQKLNDKTKNITLELLHYKSYQICDGPGNK